MKIHAGQLDIPLELYSRTTTVDADTNQDTVSYVSVGQLMARAIYTKSDTSIDISQQFTETDVKFIVRFWDGYVTTMRLRDASIYYEIQGITEPDGSRRQWQILNCKRIN